MKRRLAVVLPRARFDATRSAAGRTASHDRTHIERSLAQRVPSPGGLQGTFVRVGYSKGHVAGSAEAFTANAHIGLDNSDGSYGVNAGAAAAAASGEITAKHSGWSVTGGLTAGIGAEGHLGIRDDDKDGKPEICARVAFGVGIGGLCIEMPVVIKP